MKDLTKADDLDGQRELVKADNLQELAPAKERKYNLVMRFGAFLVGVGFLGLAAADAMYNPFPGTDTFFGGTGVVLISIGIAGKAPKIG
jgi:hypothetical protein